MAADFKINLSRELTSSEEERVRFYNGMLVYLVVCAAALVFVAYLASMNIKRYIENNGARAQMLRTTAAVADIDERHFRNPNKAYAELEAYSFQLASLRKSLGQRVQLLPVVHNLFQNLPNGVALRSLSANKTKVNFGLVMPNPSEGSDPVKDLRKSWENNEELMSRVASIRPVTGERRTMNGESMFFVQFECVLKK